jgi:hypothetical protein
MAEGRRRGTKLRRWLRVDLRLSLLELSYSLVPLLENEQLHFPVPPLHQSPGDVTILSMKRV